MLSFVLFVKVHFEIHTYEGSVLGKIHGGSCFYCVGCYERLGEHEDFVFSAKQRPKNFMHCDDVLFL